MSVMGTVRGIEMADREKLATQLKYCIDSEPAYRCETCDKSVCKSTATIGVELVCDAISELCRDDETHYGIKIPEPHIDRVLNKFQFYISQLQVCEEECSELIQAISKNIRVMQGTTNVTKEETRQMIVEELTHVAIALHMLQKIYDIKQEEIDAEIARKAAELDKEGL